MGAPGGGGSSYVHPLAYNVVNQANTSDYHAPAASLADPDFYLSTGYEYGAGATPSGVGKYGRAVLYIDGQRYVFDAGFSNSGKSTHSGMYALAI